MKNEYEKTESKIPYDGDTIIRQTAYKKSRGSSSGNKITIAPSKALAFLICVILIFNIILGIVVFTRRGGGTTVNNNQYEINSEGLDVSAVVQKALPSVVMVNAGLNKISASDLNADNFGNMEERGSGVIIEDDKESGTAYILTCYHVIREKNVNEVYIMLSDSDKPIQASRVSTNSISSDYDLAVLKIENQEEYKKSKARPCTVAESPYVVLGEDIVAIGNPQGKGISVTDGVVSVTSELISVSGSSVKHRVMRISSPINAGNSGGGLFNSKGELLGIVSAKSNDTSLTSIDCIAYAIPSTLAANIAFNMIRNSSPVIADFGMTLVHDDSGVEYQVVDGKNIAIRKVFVGEVEEGSSAYVAGINQGDRIISFSFSSYSVNMINKYTLEDYAFAMDVSTEVTFLIERRGEIIPKTLTISKTKNVG